MSVCQTTIIIPNFNGIHYLGECLKSVYEDLGANRGANLGTDKKITPVIVIDNGSTDGSIEFLNRNYPDLKLIALAENTGFANAVNLGIKAAASEFVILLNNDTVIKTGFINGLTEAIKEDDRIFSVAAKMLKMEKPDIIDSAGDFYSVFGWAYARGKGKRDVGYEKEIDIFSACAGAAIYRRSALLKLGLFDEAHFAYLEDVDIGYSARLNGYKNRFCPEAKVLHAGSASSGSRYNEWKTSLASRNSVYLIYKNMPVLQLILNLPFLLAGFLLKFLFFSGKNMGLLYLKGLVNGLKLSFTAHARARKVRFRWANFKYYLLVQLEMYKSVLLIKN
ncbi:MAG: glycosyltransferase family 2 protein [Lachnospiraceae bacterium]|nr:glycosyltransferase family 2 protein [Lachnospiraceae bacterium]